MDFGYPSERPYAPGRSALLHCYPEVPPIATEENSMLHSIVSVNNATITWPQPPSGKLLNRGHGT